MEGTEGQGELRFWMEAEGKRIEVMNTQDYANLTDFSHVYVTQMCDQGKLIATKYHGRWWVHMNNIECYLADDLPLADNLS